jgi:hypothetical protein
VLGLLGANQCLPAFAGEYRLPAASELEPEVVAAAAQMLAHAFSSGSESVGRATQLAGRLLEVSTLVPDQYHPQSEAVTAQQRGSATGAEILRVYRSACEHAALNLGIDGIQIALKEGTGGNPALFVEPRIPESWDGVRRSQAIQALFSICHNVWDVRFHGSEFSLELAGVSHDFDWRSLLYDHPGVEIPGYFTPKET